MNRPAVLLDLAGLSWPSLILGMLISGAAAMSVHVFMFDVMLVPHPTLAGVPSMALFINDSLSLLAMLWLCRLLEPALLRIALPLRCLLVSALVAMLDEALFRNIVMDGVVSNDWRFSLIENLARPAELLLLCSLVVLLSPRLQRAWQMVIASLALAALASLLINPALSAVFQRLTASFEYLDTGNIYNPPYGWQVNVPSYLTFAEPVVACFVIVAACWARLAGGTMAKLAQFALIIMSLKGSIAPTLVYSFFQPLPLPRAVASEGQFGLEILVLAVLTGLSWQVSTRRRRDALAKSF